MVSRNNTENDGSMFFNGSFIMEGSKFVKITANDKTTNVTVSLKIINRVSSRTTVWPIQNLRFVTT